MTDWSVYRFDEERARCSAPRLEDLASLQAPPRAYQALLLPTFHPTLALTVYDFGDHADVSVHAATKDARTWRETKTIIREPLETFRAAMLRLVSRPVPEAPDGGRDGILVEASWLSVGECHRVHGWSPANVEPIARFVLLLLSVAEASLQLDESRTALAPIRRYF